MEATRTYIYGASGHGKVILDILEANGVIADGFIDDDPSKTEFAGLPISRRTVLGKADILILGVGDNKARSRIASGQTCNFINAIHPSASVSKRTRIGIGTVVMHHAVIQTGSKIGDHCIINTGASVDHDCVLENYVHVSPGATVCGNVNIGELTWIGAGSTIIQGVTIGKNVVVAAGAVVRKDVPDNSLIAGNPAEVKRNFIK